VTAPTRLSQPRCKKSANRSAARPHFQAAALSVRDDDVAIMTCEALTDIGSVAYHCDVAIPVVVWAKALSAAFGRAGLSRFWYAVITSDYEFLERKSRADDVKPTTCRGRFREVVALRAREE